MIIKNIIKYSFICSFAAQVVNSSDIPNQRGGGYETSHQRVEINPTETNKGDKNYIPSKETITGLSLTLGGLYSIFSNKNIPYKYKLGILGVALGTGIIYCSDNTSSLIKHAYTAVGSAALSSVPSLALGFVGGTIFGGGSVILYFYYVNNRPITFQDALISAMNFFADKGVQTFLATSASQNVGVRTEPDLKRLSE